MYVYARGKAVEVSISYMFGSYVACATVQSSYYTIVFLSNVYFQYLYLRTKAGRCRDILFNWSFFCLIK